MGYPAFSAQPDEDLLPEFQKAWNGLDNNAHPPSLAEGLFSDGENLSIREEGVIQSKPGSALWGDDSIGGDPQAFLTYTPQGLVAQNLIVSGGQLYARSHGGTWDAVAGMALTNTASRVNLQPFNNVVYILSGDASDNVYSYDGTAITDEGNNADNDNPPQSLITCVINNRMFALLDDGTIPFSDSLNAHGGGWDKAVNRIRPDFGGTDIGTAMRSFGDRTIFFGMQRHLGIINVSGEPATWYAYEISDNIGVTSQLAIQQVGPDVWFQAFDKHWYKVEEILIKNKYTFNPAPVSLPISGYINNLSDSALTDTVSLVSQGYFFFVADLGGTTYVFPYDIQRGGWTVRWSYPAIYLASGFIGAKERVFYVQASDSQVVEFLTGTTEADGTYAPWSVVTRGFTGTQEGVDLSNLPKEVQYVMAQVASAFGTTKVYLLDEFDNETLIATYTIEGHMLWGSMTWGSMTWGGATTIPRREKTPRIRSLYFRVKIVHTEGTGKLRAAGVWSNLIPWRRF